MIIKIFLASSEELKYERVSLGDLVRKLNRFLRKRDIELDLFKWEDYSSSYNSCRKQDEYNAQIRDSQIFIALFYRIAGQYTLEEFEVAKSSNINHGYPKVYIFCKELQNNEIEKESLKLFKQKLDKELGHFWCKFETESSLHLQFVLQLLDVEDHLLDELKIKDGIVSLGNIEMAQVADLPFISEQRIYKELQAQLNDATSSFVDKKRHPEIKKELQEFSQCVFNCYKHLSKIVSECLNESIREVFDALRRGNLEEAIEINDKIVSSFDYESATLDSRKRFIDVLAIKAKLMLADTSHLTSSRITSIDDTFKKAVLLAVSTDYALNKHIRLLDDYVLFLSQIGNIKKASEVLAQVITLCEANKLDNPYLVYQYSVLAGFFEELSENELAVLYYKKACDLGCVLYGEHASETIHAKLSLAQFYLNWGDDAKSEAIVTDCLTYLEKNTHIDDVDVNTSLSHCYLVMGGIKGKESPSEALKYYELSIRALLRNHDKEYELLYTPYFNMATTHVRLGNNKEAEDYLRKAIPIMTSNHGLFCDGMLECLILLSKVQSNQGELDESNKTLDDALFVYNNMAVKNKKSHELICRGLAVNSLKKKDVSNALSHIGRMINGISISPELYRVYNDAATLLSNYRCLKEAIAYYERAAKVAEEVFGVDSQQAIEAYKNILLYSVGIWSPEKKLELSLKVYGLLSPSEESSSFMPKDLICYSIGSLYMKLKQYDKAEPFLIEQFEIKPNFESALILAVFYANIKKDYQKAIDYYLKVSEYIKGGAPDDVVAKHYQQMCSLHDSVMQYLAENKKKSSGSFWKCLFKSK